MEYKWTNGWEVINFTINDNQYHGFIKVTKKGEITIECRKDVDCRPLDKVKVDSYQNLPGGGEYIYSTEQTLYTGKGIGKWRLENDGSFTKIGW